MSRAHAVAPVAAVKAPPDRAAARARTRTAAAPGVLGRARTRTSVYLERAMLLWPRLDPSRLRRVAADPARIAVLVERRTAQPFDVILAMLTRQTEALAAPAGGGPAADAGSQGAPRVALRIVRSDERAPGISEAQDRVPA